MKALCALAAGAFLVAAASGAAPAASGRIAFTITDKRTTKIYTVRPDGSDLRIVSRFRCCGIVSEHDPAWSRDGRQLAFSRGTYRTRGGLLEVAFEIHIRRGDGAPARRLAPGTADQSPTWSPDGRSIAFSREDVTGEGVASIMVVRRDGSRLRRLTAGHLDRMPAWSPSGSVIAFARNPPSPFGAGFRQSRLMLIEVSGSNVRHFPGKLRGWSPAWSPDGRRLAFVSDGDVYIVNADGSGRRRLTRTARREGGPTWSPDGRWLAFDGAGGLHRIGIAGGRPRLIAPEGADAAWRPR